MRGSVPYGDATPRATIECSYKQYRQNRCRPAFSSGTDRRPSCHALNNASRLAEVAGEKGEFWSMPRGSEDVRAAALCAETMRCAALIAGDVGAPHRADEEKEVAADGASIEQAMVQLEHCAKSLGELQRAHRKVTFSSV